MTGEMPGDILYLNRELFFFSFRISIISFFLCKKTIDVSFLLPTLQTETEQDCIVYTLGVCWPK